MSIGHHYELCHDFVRVAFYPTGDCSQNIKWGRRTVGINTKVSRHHLDSFSRAQTMICFEIKDVNTSTRVDEHLHWNVFNFQCMKAVRAMVNIVGRKSKQTFVFR